MGVAGRGSRAAAAALSGPRSIVTVEAEAVPHRCRTTSCARTPPRAASARVGGRDSGALRPLEAGLPAPDLSEQQLRSEPGQ